MSSTSAVATESRFPVGSSARISAGFTAIARAPATRRSWQEARTRTTSRRTCAVPSRWDRARRSRPRGWSGQGFGCVHTDTLQSDEADTLESNAQPDDPGTEFLTCDYVRPRRWGQSTQRRYLVVLYLREHRVRRVFAVTHLLEVH